MPTDHRRALSAVAFELAAALQAYQADFAAFVAGPCSLAPCRTASRRLDDVVRLRGALPELAVPMVELLVCHTELVHVVFGAVACSTVQRGDLLQRHREAVEAMQARCLRMVRREAEAA